jgi:hypothetical protein
VGRIRCERHGLQGIAFASERGCSAVAANVRADVGAIRYVVFDEDYPFGRAWVEPETARAFADRVLGIEEIGALDLPIVCHECLDAWLRDNGITALSPDEERFVSLTLQLEILRPRLEATIEAIGKAVFTRTREPTGRGFPPNRDHPFRAYVGTRSAQAFIEVRDRRDALEATATSSLFQAPPPPPLLVALVDDRLSASELERLVAWVDEANAWLRRGLASL